jgi:hypothetical protein
MVDETLAESNPQDWNRIKEIYQDMISLIGKKGLDHVILDPVSGLMNIAGPIRCNDYSTVIDLTGWLGSFVKKLAPGAEIIDSFSLSRVRDVSSPDLTTTSHIIKCSSDQLSNLRERMDRSNVLIIDDVSFSGGTGIDTARIFNIERADHAYILANTGKLGSRPGAVEKLNMIGHGVVYGFEIHTPNDDGWHLKDFHQIPNLEKVFMTAMQLQEMMGREGADSPTVNAMLRDPAVTKILFPNGLKKDEIMKLTSEGRFLLNNGYVPNEDALHVPNPVLWASQYLMDHVDRKRLLENKEQVLEMLVELKRLTPGYKTVKPYVDKELENIAQRWVR